MTTTTEVVQHHLQCFGDGDLEGILSDYAPGAVLFTPDRTLKGRTGEARRRWRTSDTIPLRATRADHGEAGSATSFHLEETRGHPNAVREPLCGFGSNRRRPHSRRMVDGRLLLSSTLDDFVQ